MSARIHPSAVIDPRAELGEDVEVGPGAVIAGPSVIGARSRIGALAVVHAYTRMGTDNIIHSQASIGGEPQDLKFSGEVSWLEIGSHNVIREFATLHRGTEGGGGVTRLGDHNLCMAYIHVAHDCHIGSHVILSNNATLAGHVTIGDHAILGGLCAVHQFTRVGNSAFVGGMTGIPQDLPPYMLATGYRGRVLGPNLVGLRRAGVSREVVSALKSAYRAVWHSGLLRAEALDKLESEYAQMPQVMEFVAFIRASKRGLLPGGKNESPDA